MLGVGVMISNLGDYYGGGTEEAIKETIGKAISSLAINDDKLMIGLEGGTTLVLFDDGQSCCEYRYMHTDDPLGDFVGSQFRGAEVRDGPTEADEWGESKESQFLIVHTSSGDFTVVNYNEHNGYYGGFWIVASTEQGA